MLFLEIVFGITFVFANGVFGEDYEEGPECIVHHPPHNDQFSCGSLCDPTLLEAEVVTAVYLTGFYANFDCIHNKTSIKVWFLNSLIIKFLDACIFCV